MNIREVLKAKIRLAEIEYTNASTELYRANKAADEASIVKEFTEAQLLLLKAQINELSDAS